MEDVDSELSLSLPSMRNSEDVKKIIKSNGTMGLLLANILRRKAAHVIIDSAK